MHFREAEKNGSLKDFSDAAAGTTMTKDVVARSERAGSHGTDSV
jgi:hypothetical protein